MSMIRKKKNQNGITLVELMIVLVIIGILASFAMIRYSKATKKAKIREAAIFLSYLWDIQYEYYLENGNFLVNEVAYPFLVFEANTGYSWFDEFMREQNQNLLYDPPSGKSKFYYITMQTTGGLITYAFPKTSSMGWNFSEGEVDNSLDDIYLAIDNDRSIYVYGFGSGTTEM
mgnify:CR=1 FL=1